MIIPIIVAAVLLAVFGVIGFIVYKKKTGEKKTLKNPFEFMLLRKSE